MNKDKSIYIIKPSSSIKYRKFCNMIYRDYHKDFIIKQNNKVSINIPNLMNILIDKLKPAKDDSYARHVTYKQIDIINGIINVLNNNTYWTRYKGIVKGKYLNQKHNEYCDWGVYECMYLIILELYYKDNKYTKLKHQSIDTTFIRNLYGTEMIQRNPHYKSKNGIKVSSITDDNGVSFSYAIAKGAKNDAKIALEQINNNFIDVNTKQVENNNRYKQNFYGDAMYDNKELINALKKKKYKPIIDVNIRNTKNAAKRKQLKKRKNEYIKVRNKRAKIEISYAWMHKYPKLDRFVEKTIKSYSGLLLLASAMIVNKKLS